MLRGWRRWVGWRGQNVKKPMLLLALLVILFTGLGYWRVSHRDTKIWSWTLGNKVIVIDAGHGGVDPGAVGKTKILEKNVTLAVSKYLSAFVEQGGAKAVMVRTEDTDLGTSQGLLKRKREDLAARLKLAEDSKADVYLSIHANSFPNEKLTGPQTFYYVDSVASKELAQAIQQELNKVANSKRVIKGNKEFFLLKKAQQATVTVELGFLSNSVEEQKLISPDYQQKLAWAIYQGLCNYFSK